MNKMNNKGFLLAESLIVATFVLTVLIYLFVQFKNLMIEYKKTYTYNTVEDIYNLGSISNFIKENKLIINDSEYIYKDNGSTSEIPDDKKSTLNDIAESMKVDYIIYADSNIDNVKSNLSSYDQDMQDFIERVSTKKIEGKGRLLAKFKNGNFATIITEKVLMPIIKKWTSEPTDDFHDPEIVDKIYSAEFLSNTNVPDNIPNNHVWDISLYGNKSVMAWLTDDGTGGYILHIGGDQGVIANPISSYLFQGLYNLKSINFNNSFDTSNVTEMVSMFADCGNLSSLENFNSLSTEKLVNMSGIFASTNLKEIDLSNFNTSKVTDMSASFFEIGSLERLDLSTFDTSNVTNMGQMFESCENLEEITFGNFNTSKVTDMRHMFAKLSSMKSLDLSRNGTFFDTKNVENMDQMFLSDYNLEELILTGWDTSKVTDMKGMFGGCSSLTELDLSSFDTSSVKNMGGRITGITDIGERYHVLGMFGSCTNLKTIIGINNFNTQNVTNMAGMFQGCENLETLNLSSFNTSNVTNMDLMFDDTKKLGSLSLCSFNTSNVTTMKRMFSKTNLANVNVGSGWSTSQADTSYIFEGSNISSVTTGTCSG